MKTIQWKVVLTDDNRIASMKEVHGFPKDSVESHLLIVGILENLKSKQLEKLDTSYRKVFKGKIGEIIKEDEDTMNDNDEDDEDEDEE